MNIDTQKNSRAGPVDHRSFNYWLQHFVWHPAEEKKKEKKKERKKHVTCDMQKVLGGEQFVKISAP